MFLENKENLSSRKQKLSSRSMAMSKPKNSGTTTNGEEPMPMTACCMVLGINY
jgi:hypothetical protein